VSSCAKSPAGHRDVAVTEGDDGDHVYAPSVTAAAATVTSVSALPHIADVSCHHCDLYVSIRTPNPTPGTRLVPPPDRRTINEPCTTPTVQTSRSADEHGDRPV